MKRCLAITGVFPPYGGAGAVRQVKLFGHLAAHGWQVDVIAPRGRAGWYRDRELEVEAQRFKVVRVGWPGPPEWLEEMRAAAKDPARPRRLHRVSRLARQIRDLVAVPDEKGAWAAVAAARARLLLARERYDAVLTSSLPYSSHLAGLALRRTGGPGWVAEHRDPWVGHAFRAQRARWRRALDERMESAVIEAADAVSVVSPTMRELLFERYGASVDRKLSLITNGYDAADFDTGVPARVEPFELLYVGTFDARLTPPDQFLEALARVIDGQPAFRDRLVFRVIGGADLEASATIRRWIAEHDAEALVRVEGFAGHRSATRAMCGAGALALPLAPGAAWVLTSKVFEYLASGRPILASVPPGDCRALLERCGGALIADATDAAGLAQQLRALLEGRVELPVRRAAAIAELDFERIAGQMAALLEGVSSR